MTLKRCLLHFITVVLILCQVCPLKALFYETKISAMDMKVQVYSNFSKNKIWKK
jgi:hypothetical protein